MSLHKLSAGDGYQYLTRQVAVADEQLQGRDTLSDYYSAKGEAPGVWLGAALVGIAGVEAGSTVTSEQMRALFGEGRHPDADGIEAAIAAAGGTPKEQDHASRLGNRFRTAKETPRDFVIECAREYEAWNTGQGNPRTAPVPAAVRAEIRTRVGRRLFQQDHGRPPADTRELSGFIGRAGRPREQACAGYDLTFSPVKSVSTLWAVADIETAKTIQAAHDAAARDTIEWLEREVIYTRRGADGAKTVDVTGLLATAFTHRDSRAGDPDLHTHIAIANKVQDPTDGRWLAIDGQVLYKHTVAASERYNTRLEAELNTRMGLQFADVKPARRSGRVVREVVGVDPQLMKRWSSRKTAIDARLSVLVGEFQSIHGRVPTSKEALALAQQANLETREAKHEHRSWAAQRTQWAAEAQEVLGSVEAVNAMVADAIKATPAGVDATEVPTPQVLAEAVLAVVEHERATFQSAHLRAEIERQVRGLGLPGDDVDDMVEATYAAVQAHLDLVVLERNDSVREPSALLRSDGTSQYTTPGSGLLTTTRIQSAERYLVATAQQADGHRAGDVDVAVGLLSAVKDGRELNEGQRALVSSMATSGRDLQLALAPAGSGKTTAMKALAIAWRSGGGDVLALAPSAVAAAELGSATEGPADTLAKLIWDLEQGVDRLPADHALRAVGPKTMLLVDEAGMAGTTDLATVVAFAAERGAVVRLIGDDRQLAAVGAGGVLRDIATTTGVDTLADVVRFRVPGEAAAGLAMRDGRVAEAIGFYLDQSRVRAASPLTAADDVFAAWHEATVEGRSTLMMAADVDTVNELNGRARAARLAATLEPRPTRSAVLSSGLEASIGDTIVTRRNDRRLRLGLSDHVKNGDRFTVLQVNDDGSLQVQHDTLGRARTLPADYVAEHVDLGYATTVHGAQGQTVERAYALVTPSWDRAAAYVALTRGTHDNVAFVVTGGDGDPHNVLTPEQIEQPTATEAFLDVLSREASGESATTAHATAMAPEVLLARAARIYADGTGTAAAVLAGPDAAARLELAAEELVEGVTASHSWEQLSRELLTRELAGEDAVAILTTAAATRDVDDETARDTASVLLWRISPDHRAGGPLPWLQPAAPAVAADPTYGPWLTARAEQIAAAADAVRATARSWTVETAPAWAQRLLEDRDLVADLAVWRAARRVELTDLRPAGATPTDRYARQTHTRLTRRLNDSGGNLAAATQFWGEILEAHPEITSDPWWPVLAQRLDDLSIGGFDLSNPALDDLLTAVEQAAATLGDAVAPPNPDTEQHEGSLEADGGTSRDRIVELNRAAHDFFHAQAPGSWVGAYLDGRNLDPIAHKAGYAPAGPRALVDHLNAAGCTDQELLDAGLAVEGRNGRMVDRFRDRLMLTIYANGDDGAEPVAFAGRAPAGSTAPKYLNTSTTVAYVKGDVLYGLAEHADLLRAGAIPVLVEGQFDAEAITLASGGTHVGLCGGGTALTSDQIHALGEYVDLTTTPVIVGTDHDAAGQKAAVRAWGLLLDAGATDPRALVLGHNDPAAVLEHGSAAELVAALGSTRPLLATVVDAKLAKWDHVLDHIDGRFGVLRDIAEDYVRANGEQQAWAAAKLIAALDVDVDIIHTELDNAVAEHQRVHGPGTVADDGDGAADAGQETVELHVDDDGIRRDDRLVIAALNDALRAPLPDEHAAAALWSRMLQLTPAGAVPTSRPDGQRGAVEQLLASGVFEDQHIAEIMATPAWMCIDDQVQGDLRADRRDTLANAAQGIADDGTTFSSVDAYAADLLNRLTTTAAAADRPTGLSSATTHRQARIEQLRRRRADEINSRRSDPHRHDPTEGDQPRPRL